MTTQRTFKRRVRERMAKTGESYTAARRMLTRPEPPTYDLPQSDEVVRGATGHGWQHWLALLDEWGAESRSHTESARWLTDAQGVPGWWAQTITLGYERARGRRAPGQHAGGFTANATKTVNVPVERLWQAWEESLTDAPMRVRTATPPKSARYDWEDGSTRVLAGFASKGDAKSTVAVAHERLPDAEAAERMKALWRERLAALKTRLEAS